MKVYYFTRTYNSWGSSITGLGDVLEHLIDANALGVSELSVDVHFATALPPEPSLEALHEKFQQKLVKLPTVRYEKHKQRLTIAFKSERGLAEDSVHEPLPADHKARQLGLTTRPRTNSPVHFRAAFAELEDVLRALIPRLSGKPGLRYKELVDEVARVRAALPQSDADVEELYQSCATQRRAALDAEPWWKQLGIEWHDYHPKARTLLDDPMFWDVTDDTWHDVLAEFKKWRPRNRERSPSMLLEKLLRAWGVDDGANPDDDDDLAQTMRNDASIALAFAQIKMEGACDRDLRDTALAAIERQVSTVQHEGAASELARLRDTLLALP